MRDTEATLLGCAVHGVGKPERRNCNDRKWKVTDTAGRRGCAFQFGPLCPQCIFAVLRQTVFPSLMEVPLILSSFHHLNSTFYLKGKKVYCKI